LPSGSKLCELSSVTTVPALAVRLSPASATGGLLVEATTTSTKSAEPAPKPSFTARRKLSTVGPET
jgi:hypothetical protein